MLAAMAVFGRVGESMAQERRGPSEPRFLVGAYAVPAGVDSEGAIDVFLSVEYSELQFLQLRRHWEASYQINVDVLGEGGMRLAGHLVERTVRAENYEETGAQKRQVSYVHFDLPAGSYDVTAVFRDLDNVREDRVERAATIEEVPAGRLALSDIILLGDREEAIAGDFMKFSSALFQEKSSGESELFAVFKAVGAVQGEVEGKAYFQHPGGDLRGAQDFTMPGESKWRFVEMSTESLAPSEYEVVIDCNVGGLQAESRRNLVVRTPGISPLISDLDEAVKQLLYVADKSERNAMLKATGDEQQELFLAFWSLRDPTPGTPKNELMDEYYQRIRVADERFRCFRAGWKTDRGRVYVRFGEPLEVERRPFELDSYPYEVWQYYGPSRRFVFMDRSGFGDYDLVDSAGANYRLGVD